MLAASSSSSNNNWRLQQVLDDNGMEIPEIAEGPSTLMMAVSKAVLGSADHANKLQQYCKKHVKNLIETKTVSKKMESFVQGDRWMIDYYTNPQLKCFERLNLELVSVIFSAKVIVYTINQEQLCLKAVIYNNNTVPLNSDKENTTTISLYQHDHKHYHCAKFKKQNTLDCSHIAEELLNKILGEENTTSNKSSPIMKAVSKDAADIPAEIIVPKKIEQQTVVITEEPQQNLSGVGEWTQQQGQTRRQSFQRRHKKSLSDTFNPFQVRVPNEFLDLFKGSNDFTANAQFLSLISAHHSTFAQKDNNNSISGFGEFRQTPTNQGSSMLNNINNNNTSNDNNNNNSLSTPAREMGGNQSQNLSRFANNSEINNLKNHSNIYNIEEHDEMLGMTNHISSSSNNNSNINSGNSNISGTLSNEPQQLNEPNQQLNQLGQLHHQSIDFFNSGNLLNSMPSMLQSYPTAPINLLSPNFNEIPQLPPPSSLPKSLSFTNPSQQSQQSVLSQIQNNPQQQQQLSSINENLRRYMGSLKFFDENKNYGFIVMDDDNRDIFVHYDDLQKAGITKEFLKSSKQGNVIRFSFSCMQYIGKYKQSKKAVELQVMPYNPALSALRRQYHFSYISATPSS